MSLVEKALRKLQASGGLKSGEPRPPELPPTGVPPAPRAEVRRAVTPKPHPGRSGLGSARLVEINVPALRGHGVLPPAGEERELAEQYRTIKRPLLRSAFQPEAAPAPDAPSARAIMVTSALPGDGKTFTALNLALSMARERDYSVVLVDADVAKRDISGVLGLGAAAGLLDVLGDPSRPVESVISPTNYPGLSVLPAGNFTESATELLASARMREVMSSLIELDPQCVILLDSPPILLTTEAPILASLFGQVVVVVRAGQTPQHAVLESVRIIGAGPHVSLVLNGADAAGPAGYHYGSYGFGLGYYRPADESGEAGDNRE